MTSNYDQLKTKAVAYGNALDDLRTKQETAVDKATELEQAQVQYNEAVTNYEMYKSQSETSEEQKDAIDDQILELRAQRTSLVAEKADAIAARDAADAAVTAKEAVVDGFYNDDGTSGSIQVLEASLATPLGELDTINEELKDARIEVDQLEALLAEKEAHLVVLQAQRDEAVAANEPTTIIDAEIATLEGEITTVSGDLETARDLVTTKLGEQASKTDEITAIRADIASEMVEYRSHQEELVTLRETLAEAKAEFTRVSNLLDDIVLAPGGTQNADANVAAADGEVGSKLELLVQVQTALATLDYSSIVTAYETAKDARQDNVTDATAAKITADGEVTTASTTVAQLRADLDVLVANQKKIEVDAAAALLEDFLKNYSVVVSGAPEVGSSVQTLIDKTCPSSKVRSLVSRINAAYADEADYLSLRAQFKADPVGSFFNAILDACFGHLSKEEADALRDEIKAAFGARAAALFVTYALPGTTPTPSTPSTSSLSTIFIIIAILVVVALVVFFLFMRR